MRLEVIKHRLVNDNKNDTPLIATKLRILLFEQDSTYVADVKQLITIS